jgi:hypothetical protein
VIFGHPLMLLGLGAALIPLLIHLFDRRRAKPQPFSAIAFVLRSQRRTASRFKLKRLILYTLRTLLFLAIPLALALPKKKEPPRALAATPAQAATAVILDASFGMRFVFDGRPLFERAREEAREALAGLSTEEPATVLVCGGNPAPPPAVGFDRARLRAALDDARPSFEVSDMSRCLALAAHALEESPVAGKRLVVVSAFFANAFHPEALAPVNGPDGKPVHPEVVLRDVAPGAKLDNHALVAVKPEAQPQEGPRVFQLALTAHNFSGTAQKDVQASLRVKGQVVAKAFLDLPAQGDARKTLTHRFDVEGPTPVEVQLSADNLAQDDTQSLVLRVPKGLRTLVVNGDPNPVKYQDGAFYVDAALSATGSPAQATVEDAEVALRGELTAYDLVVLLDVPAPSEAEAAKLKAFVHAGGGLLVAGGAHVDPDAYNARLGELLPSPLRAVKTAVAPNDPDVERRAARLKDLDLGNPLFTPFQKAHEGLLGARFYRYLLTEAVPKEGGGAQVLAAFEDGAPALLYARRGKGKVLFFSSTLSHEWTDLPIRSAFLPLVQRLVAFLGGGLDEPTSQVARVGQPVVLSPGADTRIASVRAPSGVEVPLAAPGSSPTGLELDGGSSGAAVGGAAGGVRVGPLPEPGLYTVRDQNGQELPALAFSAALDPAASDLTKLSTEELAATFGEASVKGLGVGARASRPLWTWFLLAGALAFFLEGALLRR